MGEAWADAGSDVGNAWRVQACGEVMIVNAAMSTETETAGAAREVCRALSGVEPDLAVVFASHHHGPEFEELLEEFRTRLNPRNLIGCTGEGIIGPDREVERSPAVAVWAAKMPGVKILPFVLDQGDIGNLGGEEEWRDRAGVLPRDRPSFIVFPDPFSIDAEYCLSQLNQVFPGANIVGGMASGAEAEGQNRLFLNDQVFRQGLVGVSVSGPVVITAVVSQGCRPVGEPLLVTKAEGNVIQELRGKPAMEVLRRVYDEAPAADRALIQQQGLQVGCMLGGGSSHPGRSEVLIRSVLGVVEDQGLALNTVVQSGQVVQFHVRDAQTATSDLRTILAEKIAEMGKPPAGGLLFSCNGRGRRMFGVPHHDIKLVNSLAGGCPVAGFFAGGEIGPVGGRTYVHGFTSSLALFRDA